VVATKAATNFHVSTSETVRRGRLTFLSLASDDIPLDAFLLISSIALVEYVLPPPSVLTGASLIDLLDIPRNPCLRATPTRSRYFVKMTAIPNDRAARIATKRIIRGIRLSPSSPPNAPVPTTTDESSDIPP